MFSPSLIRITFMSIAVFGLEFPQVRLKAGVYEFGAGGERRIDRKPFSQNEASFRGSC